MDQLRQHDPVHLEPFVHAFDAVGELLQLRGPRVEKAFEGAGVGGEGVRVRDRVSGGAGAGEGVGRCG